MHMYIYIVQLHNKSQSRPKFGGFFALQLNTQYIYIVKLHNKDQIITKIVVFLVWYNINYNGIFKIESYLGE